jgi:hypothetical protein
MKSGFAVGTSARMALVRSGRAFPAGKGLAIDVEALPSGGGRLSKVAARFGT